MVGKQCPKKTLALCRTFGNYGSGKPPSYTGTAQSLLSHGGGRFRRAAVKLIKNGLVTANGQTAKEPGTLVDLEKDTATYKGKTLKPEKPVYILLNKPKNTLCAVKGPQQRPAVLGLLEGAPPVRLYPVGRLDRNTTGILLLTNDGELAQKLLHPSTKVPRTYSVTSVKPFTQAIVESLLRGVILEEGIAKADEPTWKTPTHSLSRYTLAGSTWCGACWKS